MGPGEKEIDIKRTKDFETRNIRVRFTSHFASHTTYTEPANSK